MIQENSTSAHLYESAQAAVTKYHQRGLNNKHLCSHSSGGWKVKVRVLADLVFGETSLPGSQPAATLLCPHTAFPLCTVGRERGLCCLPLFLKDTSPVGLRPTGPHLTLSPSLNVLCPHAATLGVRASTFEFWGK